MAEPLARIGDIVVNYRGVRINCKIAVVLRNKADDTKFCYGTYISNIIENSLEEYQWAFDIIEKDPDLKDNTKILLMSESACTFKHKDHLAIALDTIKTEIYGT